MVSVNLGLHVFDAQVENCSRMRVCKSDRMFSRNVCPGASAEAPALGSEAKRLSKRSCRASLWTGGSQRQWGDAVRLLTWSKSWTEKREACVDLARDAVKRILLHPSIVAPVGQSCSTTVDSTVLCIRYCLHFSTTKRHREQSCTMTLPESGGMRTMQSERDRIWMVRSSFALAWVRRSMMADERFSRRKSEEVDGAFASCAACGGCWAASAVLVEGDTLAVDADADANGNAFAGFRLKANLGRGADADEDEAAVVIVPSTPEASDAVDLDLTASFSVSSRSSRSCPSRSRGGMRSVSSSSVRRASATSWTRLEVVAAESTASIRSDSCASRSRKTVKNDAA